MLKFIQSRGQTRGPRLESRWGGFELFSNVYNHSVDHPYVVRLDPSYKWLVNNLTHPVVRVVTQTNPGWWFGTFFIFPYIGNNHSNWLIFFRGIETTNQKVIAPKYESKTSLLLTEESAVQTSSFSHDAQAVTTLDSAWGWECRKPNNKIQLNGGKVATCCNRIFDFIYFWWNWVWFIIGFTMFLYARY